MSVETKNLAKDWLSKHVVFVLPPEDSFTLDAILNRVESVAKNGKVDGVVIDPWNELDHRRPPLMTETEYISHSLTKMRRFARSQDVHLWLVAHPTKLQRLSDGTYPVPTLYDISGSAHFRNKADMGVIVWRDVLDDERPADIHISKVRFRESGKVGKVSLYFDWVTNRYYEKSVSHGPYFGSSVVGTDDESGVLR